MSDLRQDPITGQWVVVSELRAIRPNEFRQVETRRSDLACPFCRGFEHDTPPEIGRTPSADESDDWLIRVVPNKYPAFSDVETSSESRLGPFLQKQGKGRQEIVIQSPRHVASFSQLTDQELFASIQAFQDRLADFEKDPALEHAMLFTNCRSEAGASLEHIHTQIIGAPIVSPNLQVRQRLADEHYSEHGKTNLQTILEWEQEQDERIVLSDDHWTAFCPFASRFPYQVWIANRNGPRHFKHCDSESTRTLGSMIREVVDRIERVHDFPAYNVMFHLPGYQFNDQPSNHWYVEIVPRLTRFAGYELGTGCWINHVAPRDAAQQLSALPSSFDSS